MHYYESGHAWGEAVIHAYYQHPNWIKLYNENSWLPGTVCSLRLQLAIKNITIQQPVIYPVMM